MAYLAIAAWPLGEVDHAISHIDRMQTRIAGISQSARSRGKNARDHVQIDAWRPARATQNAVELSDSPASKSCPCWAGCLFLEGWATLRGSTRPRAR